jgi:alkylation response protein AidB-like acyl-CoA dehydrogenase
MTDLDPTPNASSDGYVARARALGPALEASGDRIDRERRLPDEVVSSLIEAGLFRMLLPRSLGGGELDPSAFASVIEEVARADASTAWCLCQASGCSMSAAYLRPEVAWEIFGRDPRAVLAWGPGPQARAVAVDGGYLVSGKWSFASGCRHATWLGGHCPVVRRDGTPCRRPDGGPEARTMLFPAAAATIRDVWHVSGLRGTASDAFEVSELFVPREHSIARDDASERHQVGPLYCFPIGSLYASGFAGVALGTAASMLAALIALARDKTPRGMRHALRESAVVQSQVAYAEAQLGSARVFLHRSLEEIWAAVGRAGEIALDQRMRIRLAATYAIQQARSVADAVHQAAGADAIFSSGAFDRRFRDIHAITQQLQGRLSHFETVGQHMLGLQPDTAFL